ncbi:MAG: GNAT family N-acetyltransferase, partial [Chlorobiales bacterium]|nr:GNAT family N-acetyltransferase [Chlorobiales bacterium]
MPLNVTYRQGKKSDCREIAELDYIASDGAVEYLFHDLVPNMTAVDVVSAGLEKDVYPHTYRSTYVAENDNQVIGMALSYPAKYHCISEELENFLPEDRLDHFRDFYSSRVEGSYLLDAICVYEKYRGEGVGKSLLEHTKNKALDEGYDELSLIMFSDNKNAIKFYRDNNFE